MSVPAAVDVNLRDGGLRDMVDEYEAGVISERLRQLHGNRTRTAEDLQLSRRALLNKISKYNLGD